MNTEAFQRAEARADEVDSEEFGRCSELKVLVALDNDVVRRGLCSMLDALPTVRRTTGCGTVREALAAVLRHEKSHLRHLNPLWRCLLSVAAATLVTNPALS